MRIGRWSFGIGVFLATAATYGLIVFRLFPFEPFLKYPVLARQALDGTLSPERRLDLSPLYLGFHELLTSLGAPAGTAEVCQIFAVALATALIAISLRPRVGLGPALGVSTCFAFSGGLVTYTATLEPEAFLVLAVTVFLAALLATPRRPLAAGIALAVAVLLRPNLLPLTGLIPLGFWLEARGREPDPEQRRRAWRNVLAVALPVVLGVALLFSRNALLPGPFTPFVMNPGTVFFEGNHPWAEGTAATYPPLFPELVPAFAASPDPQHELYRLFARRATGQELTVPEVNAFWRQRATAFLVDHPGLESWRLVSKLRAQFGAYSWHDLPSAHWNERRLGWPARIATALLLGLGLVGIVVAAERWREYLPVLGVVALQVAVGLAIYASARQRLAAWPALAICAGLALGPGGTGRLAGSRRQRLGIGLLLALVCGLGSAVTRHDEYLFGAIDASSRLAAEARALRTQGQLGPAAATAMHALSMAPWRIEQIRPAYLGLERENLISNEPFRPFERGLLLAVGWSSEASDPRNPEAAFTLALLGPPLRYEGVDSSEPHYYRALAAHRRGAGGEEVRAALAAGLENTPGDPEILAAQAVLDEDPAAREALFRYWDPITANFFLGREALRFGRPEAALEPLGYVRERLPELRRAAIYLAAALAAAGRPEEGARVFVEANRGQVEPVLLEDEILGLFRTLVERHPDDPTTLRLAAAAHRQYGRYREALDLFERLDRATSGTDPAVAEALRQVRTALLNEPEKTKEDP